MSGSIIWAGEGMEMETAAGYKNGKLNLRYQGPELVYPGQQVKMEMKVTDDNNKPVVATDVTAYAITSKFDAGLPALPEFNKQYQLKENKQQLKNVNLENSGKLQLNWQRWGKALGLDTITYYQFTHPKNWYSISETTKSTLTEVAPFVIRDGNIEPVHVVYIDEVPVFFSKTNQLQHYSFVVTPGNHRIRLRTASQLISLSDIFIPGGKKTIVSIDSKAQDAFIKVVPATAELTNYESDLLVKYLVNIQDNFYDEKTLITAGSDTLLVNPPQFFGFKPTRLIGPLAQNYLSFKSGGIDQPFVKEPGYTYTFSKGLIRQKSNTSFYGFDRDLLKGMNQATDNYRDHAVTAAVIDSLWEDYLNLRSYSTSLFNVYQIVEEPKGRIAMELDSAFSKTMPFVKNIFIQKVDEPGSEKIYPGNSRYFQPLSAGSYRIMYLFKDNRYFLVSGVVIKPAGLNYFRWKAQEVRPADTFSKMIDLHVKSLKLFSERNDQRIEERVMELFNDEFFDAGLLTTKVSGVVIDEHHNPLAGVSVKVKGLSKGTVTNARGEFGLSSTAKGKITVSYIGYETQELRIGRDNLSRIILKAAKNGLNEVSVVAYGQKKMSYTSSSVTMAATAGMQGDTFSPDVLRGQVAGIMVRGSNSRSPGQKPILIVDGLPFQGEIAELKAEDIASMEVMKMESAVALYGSRAAAGVVIVKTKKGNQTKGSAGEMLAQTQTMRTRFSDYAFWQPKLITNDEGMASWNVRFPDDITSWSARLIAMNGNRQSGLTEVMVKAFKSLSANFVSPQFALSGDSIRVIGKLMNYTPAEEKVLRKFVYNGQELKNGVIRFEHSHIDTIPVVAAGADSLSFRYTLEQENGYFDGELRKIPLLPLGVTETKGYFDVLEKDTAVNYNFEASPGKVTLRAEASVFPSLLEEMEKLRTYEYLCNEQLASKLKALLLEKKIRTYLNEPFKHEKEIKDIIRKLQSARRAEGTWGWWQDSKEEMWISLHVVEALLNAEKQGYKVTLDKETLYSYLQRRLAEGNAADHIYEVKLLHLLNHTFYIKDWVNKYAVTRRQNRGAQYKESLYEQLQLIQLQQLAGLDTDLKLLLNSHKNTLFGSIYWGENNNRFWDNSIQNTLLAYQILRTEGRHEKELELIRRYFLEQRKDGAWRNTYESSLILETILPDLLVKGKKPEPASLVIDQAEMVSVFPYTKVVEGSKKISISKKGLQPVYFTAYQQLVNHNPEKVSKDFSVKTSFRQSGQAVTRLKAGVATILTAEVELKGDADYVMIEIPVPAGCSYENKRQSYWGPESHREYFKHKTSIFCTKLKAGKHIFEVELMPRYSGNYALNPAKAELMYFPVFYGREGMKRVGIR